MWKGGAKRSAPSAEQARNQPSLCSTLLLYVVHSFPPSTLSCNQHPKVNLPLKYQIKENVKQTWGLGIIYIQLKRLRNYSNHLNCVYKNRNLPQRSTACPQSAPMTVITILDSLFITILRYRDQLTQVSVELDLNPDLLNWPVPISHPTVQLHTRKHCYDIDSEWTKF